MSGTPSDYCSSDMTDDVCGRLDYDDLASRVCELVSRPAALTEEQMRRYARRQAREVGESSCSPVGRVYTVSSLDSSIDDDSSSVCDDALCSEDQDRSLRGRTNIVMSDYAAFISYVDHSRSSVEELVGDASIMSRIRRASPSSAGRGLISDWRHEPIRGLRRSSDVESCGGFIQDIQDVDIDDFEGARSAARDVLARVDGARQSRHDGSGVFLVLFGVILGILMGVSFGESMRRRETSARQQNESLPGSSVGRTRTSPPRRPWSIANLLSSAMPSIHDGAREKYDPIWYEFRGTYSDSFSFCSRHESRIPCPYSVYCPGGRGSASALQYEGDRPHDTNDRAHVPIVDLPFGWARLGVGLGEDDSISEDTCSVRIETEIDASEVSSHLLCCRESPHPEGNEVESNFLDENLELKKYVESDNKRDDRDDLLRKRLDPVWFDSRHGWPGGNHEEAASFCDRLGSNRKLCPYTAYCPHGRGRPVHGNSEVFEERELWAPIRSRTDHYVMIGRKYGNSATTCMTSTELGGLDTNLSMKDNKGIGSQYLMCCLSN